MKALLLQKALEASIALAIFNWPWAEPTLKGGFSAHRKKFERGTLSVLCHLLEGSSATSATRQFYRTSWWMLPVPGEVYKSDTGKRTKSYKSWCQQTRKELMCCTAALLVWWEQPRAGSWAPWPNFRSNSVSGEFIPHQLFQLQPQQ